MRYQKTLTALLLLLAAPAHAYIYDVGPNFVDMAGSACRAKTSAAELNLFHDLTGTQVKNGVGPQRLYCPISRRGTTFYRGERASNEPPVPPPPSDSFKHVKIVTATVRGTDSSTSSEFRCFVFGTRLSDQAVFFGTGKSLCSGSGFGCSSAPASWTGTNSMVLTPLSSFNGTVDTMNFGIICDLGSQSTLYYAETAVTPN